MLVSFFTARGGRRPVEEFIREQSSRTQAAFVRAIDLIEKEDLHARGVSFRQVRGKLWEIRIQADGAVRIFYAVRDRDEREMILLHAYKKETRKAPHQELQTAERRMREVLG
jgi:phage-related protein